MQSRRWRVIAAGIFLAIVGAALPIAAMAWTSWRVAIQKELFILDLVAERSLVRAEIHSGKRKGHWKQLKRRTLPHVRISILHKCGW